MSNQQDVGPTRAQPPIRWPRPEPRAIGLVVLWAAGVFVALFVPALLVSPMATTAPTGDVWWAFTATIIGALVMIGASAGLWRLRNDAAWFIMGAVPAFATIAGGAILTAAKLTGT